MCIFVSQSDKEGTWWQGIPDVSANELDVNAVILRNPGEEISGPPSAIIPSA